MDCFCISLCTRSVACSFLHSFMGTIVDLPVYSLVPVWRILSSSFILIHIILLHSPSHLTSKPRISRSLTCVVLCTLIHCLISFVACFCAYLLGRLFTLGAHSLHSSGTPLLVVLHAAQQFWLSAFPMLGHSGTRLLPLTASLFFVGPFISRADPFTSFAETFTSLTWLHFFISVDSLHAVCLHAGANLSRPWSSDAPALDVLWRSAALAADTEQSASPALNRSRTVFLLCSATPALGCSDA